MRDQREALLALLRTCCAAVEQLCYATGGDSEPSHTKQRPISLSTESKEEVDDKRVSHMIVLFYQLYD